VAPRIGFVSLGCPKALVDAERILTQLRAEGYATAQDYGVTIERAGPHDLYGRLT
jgi:tRNA A37 methylthiotransferase MiaB